MRTSRLVGVSALGAAASVCAAQSSWVHVSHDDADGIVAPGEVVRVKAVVSWIPAGVQFAGMKGDLRAAPNVGIASNRFSEFLQGGLVNLGQFSGGSIVGVDIAVAPSFFTGGVIVPPSGNNWGIEVISYDWQAPVGFAGAVGFDWVPDPAAPNVRFFPPVGPPSWNWEPTVYVGTSLTVVPAPVSLALVAPALRRGRRRVP